MYRFFFHSGSLPALSIAMAIALASPPAISAPDSPAGIPTSAAADLARGRSLYETACGACHSQNIHWRDKLAVKSWESLVTEVTRWQRNAGQRWEPADINNVAAYLNVRFYRLPCPLNDCAEKAAGLDSTGAPR